MRRRAGSDRRTSSLEVQIFYSVADLARVGNVPAYHLLRLLRRNGITFLRAGRAFYVSLDEIRRKIPPLWRSFRLVEELCCGAYARERDHHDHRVHFDSKGRRT